MLRRLLRLFKRSHIVVPDADKLEPGTARTIQIGKVYEGGSEIVICRMPDGGVHALDSKCPHDQGGRLMPGPLMDGRYVECPMHNFHFDPKTGRVERGVCPPARRFKIRETDGEFHITI